MTDADLTAVVAALADYSSATLHGPVPAATFGRVVDMASVLARELEAERKATALLRQQLDYVAKLAEERSRTIDRIRAALAPT